MMRERRGNGKRTPIDHWETVEVLHSDSVNVGREDVGLVIEVQRPIFEGGREGRLSMGAVLTRGERMLRFFCPGGAITEISALRSMLLDLDEETLAGFATKFDDLRDEHDPKPQRQERGSTKPGQVGGGLSRFSKTSKRERRRQKHREERSERG
jgi:hypothetical protein